jgi:hypothetical protein
MGHEDGGLKRVLVGSEIFLQKNDMDKSDKGEEMSLME